MEIYNFQVLDAMSVKDYERWLEIWKSWSNREVFAHPDYVRLYVDKKSKAYCATLLSHEGNALYPFICRSLNSEKYFRLDAPNLADIITPYGYGGPFAWGYNNLEVLSSTFWPYFDNWANKNNIVSEVIKFHLFKENMLIYLGIEEQALQNIVVDLSLTEEQLWKGFEYKVRKNVNKAKRFGIRVLLDSSGEQVDNFLDIYYLTLKRRSAEDNYYFSRLFFENLHQKLAGQFVYFYSLYNEKIISAELILVSQENIYSFLGGTYQQYFHLAPNDLLKYEIILWAKKQGKKKFVLGGGYNDNDGIFRYKKSFSPNGVVPFFVGCRILCADLYNSLIDNKKKYLKQSGIDWVPKEGFIPAYRT